MKDKLHLIAFFFSFLVINCSGQVKKEMYGVFVHAFIDTDTTTKIACLCPDIYDTAAPLCVAIDSATISVYTNNKLIKTIYTNKKGCSTRIILPPGVYTFVSKKQWFDSASGKLLLFPDGNFEFSSVGDGKVGYITLLMENNVSCCMFMHLAKKKRGVKIKPVGN